MQAPTSNGNARRGRQAMDNVFSIVPIEVATDPRLTLRHVRVLVALYSFRSKDSDIVWPKREALAERCGLRPSTISTVTTDLVRLGWLEKVGSGGRSSPSRYRLKVPDLSSVTVPNPRTVSDGETVPEPCTVSTTETVPEAGTVSSSETVPESGTVPEPETVLNLGTVPKSETVPESGTKTVPESGTRKEHTREHTKKGRNDDRPWKASRLDWSIPDWINANAWAEFEAHRREIRKPLSDLARTKAANLLKGLSFAEQQACIDKSIQSRWSGLFPDQHRRVNGSPQTGQPPRQHKRSLADVLR